MTSYADLRAPRMMVYAPNGDLFVSSPGANNITILRDTNNDGVVDSQSVYAQGEPPAPRGGGPPPAAALVPAHPVEAPLVHLLAAAVAHRRCSAPMPPRARRRRSLPCAVPGRCRRRLAWRSMTGYLYVGNTGSLVRYKYIERRSAGTG